DCEFVPDSYAKNAGFGIPLVLHAPAAAGATAGPLKAGAGIPIRAVVWLLCGCCRGGAATAPELLPRFPPSSIPAAYGLASVVHFSTGLVELESGVLAHHLPRAMRDFWFNEPVWVIAYRTDLTDARGNRPAENYLCHTFFSDERVDQRQENEIKGIYSDAFTP